jgi:hypothetical protein
MANVSGQGTAWNLLNYAGELYTADVISTPILNAITSLNGAKQTANFEFPIDSIYAHEAAAQPAITETGSLTAPTAIGYTRTQDKNVCQIFQEKVSVSYEKMANSGRLSGINTEGLVSNVVSEKDFQIAKQLEKIARDIEYTIINGVYQISTSSAVANKTRGINAAITTNAIAAAGASLDKSLLDELLRTMFGNGAVFKNPAILVNGFLKQKLSSIYASQPMDRRVGGVAIDTILTDFGAISVLPAHRFQTASTLTLIDLAVVSPVYQPIPGKGNFFYEELSKVGASEDGQIFGKFGLDHGPEFMHGKITGLATA